MTKVRRRSEEGAWQLVLAQAAVIKRLSGPAAKTSAEVLAKLAKEMLAQLAEGVHENPVMAIYGNPPLRSGGSRKLMGGGPKPEFGKVFGRQVEKIYYTHVTEGKRVHTFEADGTEMLGIVQHGDRNVLIRNIHGVPLWDDL